MEINGDVAMETNKQPTESENRASQQIDQGLLTFAITYTFQIEIPQKLMHNKLVCNEITGVYLQVFEGVYATLPPSRLLLPTILLQSKLDQVHLACWTQ